MNKEIFQKLCSINYEYEDEIDEYLKNMEIKLEKEQVISK
jgi:hypothetical protein